MMYIHDPHYFLHTTNPLTVPFKFTRLDKTNTGMKYMTMQTIKHIKLNRPEDHCEEDKSYSFTACIKNSLNKKIGCRIQRDEWSDPSWPECVHRDQFQWFEIEYDKLSRMPRGRFGSIHRMRAPLSL